MKQLIGLFVLLLNNCLMNITFFKTTSLNQNPGKLHRLEAGLITSYPQLVLFKTGMVDPTTAGKIKIISPPS